MKPSTLNPQPSNNLLSKALLTLGLICSLASCGVKKVLQPKTIIFDIKAGYWQKDTLGNLSFVLSDSGNKNNVDTMEVDPNSLNCSTVVGPHKDTLESFVKK